MGTEMTGSPAFTIDNGRGRVDVSFGPYTGKGGVTSGNGIIQVSFVEDVKCMKLVRTGTIEGAPFDVLSAARSEHDKRFVVLTVRPSAPPDAPEEVAS